MVGTERNTSSMTIKFQRYLFEQFQQKQSTLMFRKVEGIAEFLHCHYCSWQMLLAGHYLFSQAFMIYGVWGLSDTVGCFYSNKNISRKK